VPAKSTASALPYLKTANISKGTKSIIAQRNEKYHSCK
jgi:hypothetical protein